MCAVTQPSDPPEYAPQPPHMCSSNGVPSTSIVSEEQCLHSECPGSSSRPSLKNRLQTPPIPSSQHPPPQANDGRDIATELTTHGIRVRDFAYENTLPPVTAVPRFSVQAQPRARTLKRTRDMVGGPREDGEESDEEIPNVSRTFYIDSNGTGTSHAYRYQKKTATLGRTLTEPADEMSPSQGFNTRAQVFTQPLYRPVSPRALQQSALFPTTPRKGAHQSPTRSLSPISTAPQSQPSMLGESQVSEPWVDTPLVTPNGSLQWPLQDTSALPPSQLESLLPQLPDTEENTTMSQLGFTPERSQRPHVPSTAHTPSRRGRPQMPPPTEFRPRTPTPARSSRHTSGSPARLSERSAPASPTTLHEAAPPRYDLRQRPQSAKPAASRAQSRTRTAGHSAHKVEKPAPPAKKRKVTPPLLPPPPPSRTTTRGRRKNGDVKENR